MEKEPRHAQTVDRNACNRSNGWPRAAALLQPVELDWRKRGWHRRRRRVAQTAELFLVEFLEGIDLGADGIFIHQLRLHARPPLVVGHVQLRDDFGMLGCHVGLFARIGLHIEQLPVLFAILGVADQVPARAADAASAILMLLGIGALRPPADVREQDAVRPVGLRVLEQRPKTSAFDLGLHWQAQFCAGDIRQCRQHVDVGT